ncbi:Taurine catabolism dioxygenase TauD, TfdA family [Planctomycetes bacterium K2D]|nr:Taurine catabolism dioxygenase TauD, TfdA family [Planctomycetes bacterium K2D]
MQDQPLKIMLAEAGWATVPGITSESELIELARSLGSILPNSRGESVSVLNPIPEELGREGTLTSNWGKGAFPLHTDTAFWPAPARFIVFRATGDLRRRTRLLAFANIFERIDAKQQQHLDTSVWRIDAPKPSHYCSMRFKAGSYLGVRYDPSCMRPANQAAVSTQISMASILEECRQQEHFFEWHHDTALVVDNWTTLHGRDVAPREELNRTLERIYVGGL